MAVFAKLFVDDHTVEYVLDHAETVPSLTVSSTIAVFVDLLLKFLDALVSGDKLKQFTCWALLNVLWSISFHERYKTKLKENKDLLPLLSSMAKQGDKILQQYVPRSMESASKAVEGILHNLGVFTVINEIVKDIPENISTVSDAKPMIMISYCHENDAFCDKILAELKKSKDIFDIWIDRDHCTSHEGMWEKIARGIKSSQLVLSLISDAYYGSKSCRKEFNFAIKRDKYIIPVYIGEPGECDWLGRYF